jgi:hypothetical protein
MSKMCLGCVCYVGVRLEYINTWECYLNYRNEPFPGKGCDDFKAKEERYEKYVHKEE